MLDLTAAPTNKLLLEVGPEGTEDPKFGDWCIYIRVDGFIEWMLVIYSQLPGAASRQVVLRSAMANSRLLDDGRSLPLGHVSTLGEVVALYELLSQKKWPGTDQTAAPEST